ncbi:flagellar biosynthesis anti-sigma factor FlgM [Aeromonas caviae]|uniref:flagellar biosynthesis anti-sigma factor FlgM n=1 Tax=Aeromonas caviae TaxID=648 RepID=UPI00191D800D|nr:flagellar biosynthesis anti-sigma factor FlgM [Aeromonas caviae]MBL0654406.1 flagellar biosynthesis anti-sigma factor FlgM [Aeromonas caviae]MCR3937404.1 flagellar biosynthesis anti-sigma factor FlgM [Aeromonas caviae]MDU7780678.1 flagellar biosynthesis anti-sigma factor FlgM [Aeromonas caviae]
MAINNINNLANNRLQNSGSSQGVATKSATSNESSRATTVKSDSVSLTSEAQQLQQMQKTLNTASTGNESRVESLKKAVASGEYKVNSEAVARKMFSFEADLDKRLG